MVLLLAMAGALALAWRQHAALAQAQTELVRAREQIAALRQNAAAPAPAPAVAPITGAVAAASAPERPTGPEDGAPLGRPGRFARAIADLSSDPEIAPLLLNQRKRAVASRYAALLARLGLPPAQTEQLKTLLAEKQLSRSDAQMMARTQGLGREEAQRMAQQADAESDAAIKALLGEAGFNQLQDFDRTYAQRTTVGSLAERLSYAGASLQTAQQEQLIQILAANATPAPGGRGGEAGPGPFGGGGPGGRPVGPGPFLGRDISEADTEAYLVAKAAGDATALQQASAILTPAQGAMLQQMQQEENEQVKLSTLTTRRLRQVRGENRGAGPGG
mgnify:CR=1 FL=1